MLNEKQAHAAYAYDGSDHLAQGHLLVENQCGGGDDQHRRQGEKGLCNACGGVQRRHQRKAYPDKWTEKHRPEGAFQRFAVFQCLT